MTTKNEAAPKRRPKKEDKASEVVAAVVYVLYMALFIPGFTAFLGIIFAYIFESDAKSYLKSHYQYLIRSFWIGLLYFCIVSLLFFVAIGVLLFPLVVIWWYIRMVKGLKSLIKKEPIKDPETWLF